VKGLENFMEGVRLKMIREGIGVWGNKHQENKLSRENLDEDATRQLTASKNI